MQKIGLYNLQQIRIIMWLVYFQGLKLHSVYAAGNECSAHRVSIVSCDILILSKIPSQLLFTNNAR